MWLILRRNLYCVARTTLERECGSLRAEVTSLKQQLERERAARQKADEKHTELASQLQVGLTFISSFYLFTFIFLA